LNNRGEKVEQALSGDFSIDLDWPQCNILILGLGSLGAKVLLASCTLSSLIAAYTAVDIRLCNAFCLERYRLTIGRLDDDYAYQVCCVG
jgi:hypothetical protein